MKIITATAEEPLEHTTVNTWSISKRLGIKELISPPYVTDSEFSIDKWLLKLFKQVIGDF